MARETGDSTLSTDHVIETQLRQGLLRAAGEAGKGQKAEDAFPP